MPLDRRALQGPDYLTPEVLSVLEVLLQATISSGLLTSQQASATLEILQVNPTRRLHNLANMLATLKDALESLKSVDSRYLHLCDQLELVCADLGALFSRSYSDLSDDK